MISRVPCRLRDDNCTATTNWTGMVILAVEDQPITQKWLTRLLEHAFPDAGVVIASSLSDASEVLASLVVDIALIDLYLPDGSGIEIIRQVLQRNPSALCVVTTSYDDDEHILTALKAGALGYLLKDQRPTVLTEQLRLLAEGVPPLSPRIARRLLLQFSDGQGVDAPVPADGPDFIDDQLTPLSTREEEVLTLIAKGLHVSQVANMLNITTNTVCSHIKSIYRKRQLASRAEAALEARRLGLI